MLNGQFLPKLQLSLCKPFKTPCKTVYVTVFLMPSSCLSLTLIHTRIHANELPITAQLIRNLRTPASAEMNKSGLLQQASFPLSPQYPSLFPFLPIPYPFRRLLRRLAVDGLLNECIRRYFFPSRAKAKKQKKIITPDLRLGRPVTMKLTSREQRRLHQNFFKISKYKKITLRQTRHSQKPITE